MLQTIKIQNFQSFLGNASLDFRLNQHAPQDDRSFVSDAGVRLSKALTVVGANASGKTTLLKSLAFIDRFMKQSFQAKPDAPIDVQPHFLAGDLASEFEVTFEMGGKEWRYRLRVSRQRVDAESLHCKQSRAFSYVFTREWNAQTQAYVIRQQQFGLLQKEAEKVRENASLISTAAQYDVELAKKLVATPFFSNLYARGRRGITDVQLSLASRFYAENPPLKNEMTALLRKWDFGLSDVHILKHTFTLEDGTTQDVYSPMGVHQINGQEYPLMLTQESSGTQGAFLLLNRILPALQTGGLVLIDELEADLHPHMLAPILDLFFSTKSNPNNAQIIFTCHSPEVLNQLHKGQIILVEKNERFESQAWRLDSVTGVRQDDNLYSKYMAGAYGAIPQL